MNRCPLFALIVLAVSCHSESGLSDSDPMRPGPAGDASASACGYCFDDACGWEASECASDPGCAGWLACARDCPAGGQGSPSTTCLDDCPHPGTSTGATLRDVFERCLGESSGCCEGANEPIGGEGGPDGGGIGDSSYDIETPKTDFCAVDECEPCLLAIKGQQCGVNDDACSAAIGQCYHEDEPEGARHCWSFVEHYAECAANPANAAGATCSYAVPEQSLESSTQVLLCAAKYCPSCIPDPDRHCLACQLEACPDQMDALLSDADAQSLVWCRKACDTVTDPYVCRQACLSAHEAGAAAVTELFDCTQAACKGACSK